MSFPDDKGAVAVTGPFNTGVTGAAHTTPTWVSWVGLSYLAVCLWVTLNELFVAIGWPFPHAAGLLDGAHRGSTGLVFLAACGLGVSIVAVANGTVIAYQRPLLLALGAWLVGPALSITLLGTLEGRGRYWMVAVAGTAVGFGATAVRPDHFARLLRALGWFFGWGSVAAGVGQLLFGWPVVLIDGDLRHTQWLARFGVTVDSVKILNGLSPGRLFLSMVCGLLLVVMLRERSTRAPRWSTAVMVAGLVIAMMWSAGRIGVIAAGVGAVAAMIPWQRWSGWWTFSAALAVPLVPLAVSRLLHLSTGSAQWRFDLWTTYFSRMGLWAPFGLGPQEPITAIRGHAHNQLLESLSTGGWISLAGVVAFLYAGLRVARRVDDNRVTYGVIFAMCGIFAFDVLTFAPTSLGLNCALVVAVAAVVNAAGREAPRARRTVAR
jgi:hypothetical protein